MSTARRFRATITALMQATGETQADLGVGIRLSQGQISRKQAGRYDWSFEDVDRVSEHYGISPADLIAGAEVALSKLPDARRAGYAPSA